MRGDRYGEDGKDIKVWEGEEVGGALEAAWRGHAEWTSAMSEVVPFFAERHAGVDSVVHDVCNALASMLVR